MSEGIDKILIITKYNKYYSADINKDRGNYKTDNQQKCPELEVMSGGVF